MGHMGHNNYVCKIWDIMDIIDMSAKIGTLGHNYLHFCSESFRVGHNGHNKMSAKVDKTGTLGQN
jgi:hypothetical protein